MSYGLLIFRNLVLFLLKNKFLMAQTAIMVILFVLFSRNDYKLIYIHLWTHVLESVPHYSFVEFIDKIY